MQALALQRILCAPRAQKFQHKRLIIGRVNNITADDFKRAAFKLAPDFASLLKSLYIRTFKRLFGDLRQICKRDLFFSLHFAAVRSCALHIKPFHQLEHFKPCEQFARFFPVAARQPVAFDIGIYRHFKEYLRQKSAVQRILMTALKLCSHRRRKL